MKGGPAIYAQQVCPLARDALKLTAGARCVASQASIPSAVARLCSVIPESVLMLVYNVQQMIWQRVPSCGDVGSASGFAAKTATRRILGSKTKHGCR